MHPTGAALLADSYKNHCKLALGVQNKSLKIEFSLQSISPGLVEQDIITSCTDNELVTLMPKLKPEDVANSVLYCITLPEHVQVHELVSEISFDVTVNSKRLI